jgi:AP2-associated kinase
VSAKLLQATARSQLPLSMASQQAFQQYGHTNKVYPKNLGGLVYSTDAFHQGTLQPGQTISVNKYNVQVERYLSQGAWAISK